MLSSFQNQSDVICSLFEIDRSINHLKSALGKHELEEADRLVMKEQVNRLNQIIHALNKRQPLSNVIEMF